MGSQHIGEKEVISHGTFKEHYQPIDGIKFQRNDQNFAKFRGFISRRLGS